MVGCADIAKRLWQSTLRSFPTLSPSEGDPLRARRRSSSRTGASPAVFHDVLSEQSPEALLDRIADTLGELVPYHDLHIYEADEKRARARARVRARRVGGGGARERDPVRPGDHRLGGRPPQPGARQRGAPRPARRVRARDAARPGGADHRSADRPRLAEGRAEHLPHRRGRVLRRGRVRARPLVRRRRRARARQRADPRAPRAPRAHRLADRPLQPPLLPRAAALRAAAAPAARTTRSR